MNHTMAVYNLIYLGLVAIGLVIFGWIFLSTRPKARVKPMSISRWKKRENVWLAVVAIGLSLVVAGTIFHVPWRAEAKADREEVAVQSQQFGFTFAKQEFTVGRQVEFVLTAVDVNHAFAVYDPDGTFVAQAQMMPRWTQRLRVTFHKPGTYTVRCYEYCGLGHHQMTASFEVREAA